MRILQLVQNGNEIVLTTRTIEWLTHNTDVCVFDPVSFNGYQRQIDEKHCEKIVTYLKSSDFLPSSVICACDDYIDDGRLRIVDGQHRVHAFKMLERGFPERYAAICKTEIPVVVLVGVPLATEIQTFITINKTSKKVDTSLAFVLKNKLSKEGDDMVMPRAEYISVEVAQKLNDDESNKMWTNRILYEGNIKKSNCYISLNAFVRATRILVNTLNQRGYINLAWDAETKREYVDETANKTCNLIRHIWCCVYLKWPEMEETSFEDRQILQGSIGYTAITRTLVKLIKENSIWAGEVESFIKKTILSFNVPYEQWTKKGSFSKYSSESGYRLVSDTLIESIKQ